MLQKKSSLQALVLVHFEGKSGHVGIGVLMIYENFVQLGEEVDISTPELN